MYQRGADVDDEDGRRRRKQKAQLFHFALIEQVLQADADDISTYKSDRKTRDLHLSLMTNAV